MIIIPAIDIRKGKAVMLMQGKVEKETVFSPDPVKTAVEWSACGSQRLHVVDLDGAFTGKPVNLELVKRIRQTVEIPIQLGGGIREMSTLETILSNGIDFAIIGTAAITNPLFLKQVLKKYRERIIVALDAYRGEVKISGWTKGAHLDVVETAKKLMNEGVATVLYTDVEKDGMMQGPNWKGIQSLCRVVSFDVIVSGGISRIDDVKKLADLRLRNVPGVVIGKALYTGDINLKEAIEVTSN